MRRTPFVRIRYCYVCLKLNSIRPRFKQGRIVDVLVGLLGRCAHLLAQIIRGGGGGCAIFFKSYFPHLQLGPISDCSYGNSKKNSLELIGLYTVNDVS